MGENGKLTRDEAERTLYLPKLKEYAGDREGGGRERWREINCL